MRYWQYCEDVDNYAHLLFVDQGITRQLICEFMGRRYLKSWNMPEVVYAREWEDPGLSEQERIISKRLNEGLPQPDLPWLVGAESVAVVNERAIQSLDHLLGENVQILPLRHENAKYYIINVLEVIDCLDEKLSVVRHYGPACRFIKPVFKEQLVKGKHIFKLPQSASAIFVSDLFRQETESHSLKGLTWKT
jgi:hypothetical protein